MASSKLDDLTILRINIFEVLKKFVKSLKFCIVKSQSSYSTCSCYGHSVPLYCSTLK